MGFSCRGVRFFGARSLSRVPKAPWNLPPSTFDFELREGMIDEAAGAGLGVGLWPGRALDLDGIGLVIVFDSGFAHGRGGPSGFAGVFAPFISRQGTHHDVDVALGQLRLKIRMLIG